ncbi:MAG: fumarylacetoacetate hydrolase family protein [Phycisphaerae bacterium]|nr:fumarylacetoacetate hydrolase family protein [Phycisphaerae bacterium]
MRIIRFVSGGKILHGRDIDGQSAHRIDGDLFESLTVTKDVVPVDRLLAPLIPTDILCIGLNYREHASEGGSKPPPVPMLFIKAGNTLNDPESPIPVPINSHEIDFEAELAVVIGKAAKHVPRARAMDYVFGYTVANDVTARDWQREKSLGGGQFARGKSFDGFCPLGPAIVTKDEVPNPNNLKICSYLNTKSMQDGTTADMIFDVPALIESLSSTLTLRPGAVILTGTPAGVGFARNPPIWMKAGDRIVVEVETIGRLENPLTAERAV